MLPPEEIKNLREQIIAQVDANYPEDKKALAKQQIQSLTDEEFVEFLKQNNLIKDGENPKTQQCIFCSIVKGETQSYKIDENNQAIAILEINPISKAHTLIIPKEHSASDKIPESILTFAEQVSQKIKKEFNPKNINIFSSTLMGHSILNVLPIYDNENQNSPRKQATPEELQNLQEQLKEKPKPKKPIKKSKPEILKNVKIPKRIP
jgi:histidine triad (HIT) family protein